VTQVRPPSGDVKRSASRGRRREVQSASRWARQYATRHQPTGTRRIRVPRTTSPAARFPEYIASRAGVKSVGERRPRRLSDGDVKSARDGSFHRRHRVHVTELPTTLTHAAHAHGGERSGRKPADFCAEPHLSYVDSILTPLSWATSIGDLSARRRTIILKTAYAARQYSAPQAKSVRTF